MFRTASILLTLLLFLNGMAPVVGAGEPTAIGNAAGSVFSNLDLRSTFPDRYMDISLSVGTSNRLFGKAMRRIRPQISLFAESFKCAVTSTDSCSSILIAITDDRPLEFVKEISNYDGYFQVMFGCPFPDNDKDLEREVFVRIKKAITMCPMGLVEKEMSGKFIIKWESENSGNQPQ